MFLNVLAFLPTMNDDCLLMVMSVDYDACPTYWTAGQRAKLKHPARSEVPLVWKHSQYVWQTIAGHANWSKFEPSSYGDCVYIATIGQHKSKTYVRAGMWATSACEARRCVICELPINSIHWWYSLTSSARTWRNTYTYRRDWNVTVISSRNSQ